MQRRRLPDVAVRSAEQATQESTAAYVAALTTELALLARGCGLETLAYLLDIAGMDAQDTVKRLVGSRGHNPVKNRVTTLR